MTLQQSNSRFIINGLAHLHFECISFFGLSFLGQPGGSLGIPCRLSIDSAIIQLFIVASKQETKTNPTSQAPSPFLSFFFCILLFCGPSVYRSRSRSAIFSTIHVN
jgi:hypothetical protein